MRECKTTIAKHTREIHHTRLRPCRLMIARRCIIRHMQFVQLRFDSFDRGTITRFGQVASDYHKLDVGVLIDIRYGALQILHRFRIASANMRVGQQRKTKQQDRKNIHNSKFLILNYSSCRPSLSFISTKCGFCLDNSLYLSAAV